MNMIVAMSEYVRQVCDGNAKLKKQLQTVQMAESKNILFNSMRKYDE